MVQTAWKVTHSILDEETGNNRNVVTDPWRRKSKIARSNSARSARHIAGLSQRSHCRPTYRNSDWRSLSKKKYFTCSHEMFRSSTITRGRRVIGISGSLIWSKTLMELIFNPCREFRWSPQGPVSQIHSPHLYVDAPGIFSHILRSVKMLKRDWGAKATGSYRTYSISGNTTALVPEFTVEDLPLGRNAALVHEFAVKDLPLDRTLWWWVLELRKSSINIKRTFENISSQ